MSTGGSITDDDLRDLIFFRLVIFLYGSFRPELVTKKSEDSLLVDIVSNDTEYGEWMFRRKNLD